jgi:dTDP-4-amino-4,6-dideoxygalactose transaminase
MKERPRDFSLLGGPREFASDLPVAQLYFPQWERYEEAMRGIVQRRYYTNHGPLVAELEEQLEHLLGVRNAITVSNATMGLYLVLQALGLSGKVLMPAFTFIATAQAARLANLDLVFCDVDPESHHVTAETADHAMEPGTAALCAVNLWGGHADTDALERWAASRGVALLYDSAHGFGVETASGPLGRFGSAEVFSFHATKILSATEGGCVCTENDELAERIRNMRSNYGIRRPLRVPLTINARMSEAEAAIALMSLSDFEKRMAHNSLIFEAYRSKLQSIPGLTLVAPARVKRTNFQFVVLRVSSDEYGMSRDQLWSVLRSEGVHARRYFKPGAHRSAPFDRLYPQYVDALPTTDALCDTVLQLPVGALVTEEDAERVGQLIRDVRTHANDLLPHVG